MLATRILEQGTLWKPTEAELESIGRRIFPDLQATSRTRSRWPVLASIGLAAATVVAIVLVHPAEFTERGAGEGKAVLRVFCAAPAPGSLDEIPPGGRCPAGHALAFAAGARGGLTSVALRLRDPEGTRFLGPFTVTGRPGGEAPLEATPELRGPGLLEVTAAFASSPEAALSSLHGTPAAGVVIVRQSATIDTGR